MSDRITLNPRFNGPPDSAHGGYVCGVLAERMGGTAEVTLRRPPPLGRALRLERDGAEAVRLLDGETLLAEGRSAEVALEVPPAPSLAEAEAAARTSRRLGRDPLFPTCLVCGPARGPGDGFRIFPGRLGDSERVAAPWLPDTSLADADGRVRPEFLWAALDCPSAMALGGARSPEPVLLGRLTVELRGDIRAGEPCVLLGWSLDADGRKLYAATALFTAAGELRGLAKATWIRIRS